MTSVPKLFPGETVAILAGGPSLTQADVDACRGRVRVIAIKDAIRLAPWADVLYSGEIRWWRHYGDSLQFAGLRYGIEATSPPPAFPAGLGPWGVTVLRNTGPVGLETDPSGLRTGKNSGFQAVNLARHLGAKTILLLGFDMQPSEQGQTHWFGAHPYTMADSPYREFLECWPTIVEPLRQEGVEVLNCTPTSALKVFQMMSVADALTRGVAA